LIWLCQQAIAFVKARRVSDVRKDDCAALSQKGCNESTFNKDRPVKNSSETG